MDEGKELIGRLERCVMMCRGVFEEFGTHPLTDSKSEVLQVCEGLEDIFRYRIKDNSSSCGEDKDYWNFFSESLSNSIDSPRYTRVQRAVMCVASLAHLESPLGKGRALIRWSLMYKMLPEVVQHSLEDYNHVNDWYMKDSIMMDENMTVQLLQILGDLQEIQFHLPSHGQDLDSHWPTQANLYDGILVNGNLRISYNDMPERPNTPVPKIAPPSHTKRFPSINSDSSLEQANPEYSLPSEIRLVTSTLRDLKLLISSINEKTLETEVEPPPVVTNFVRRNTLAHASLPAKERVHSRSSIAGIETASKLDRLETILNRLAEKEDTRDEIHLLEKRKIEVEEDLRKSKNRNLDLQLQLTETLNASETSDAELLQELGELQEAVRHAQDSEHQTLNAYRQLELQLNEREVEFEINQELLTQADSERKDLKERCLYMQEDLEEKCFQLDELTDEINTIREGEAICDDIEVEQLTNSSSENTALVSELQNSLNDREGELTRSRREQHQMNTVIHAMKDERGRLQKECLDMRAVIPVLEKKVKDKDILLSDLQAKLTNFESYEEQKTELHHLQNKYKELQAAHSQSLSTSSEQVKASEFKISSQKIELEEMKIKMFSNQSLMSSLQNELDETKTKLTDIDAELLLNRNTINSCQLQSDKYRSEISQLKEQNLTALSNSAVDIGKKMREKSALERQCSLFEEENETLRATLLKFTEQKLALFNRADELEHELEKFMLARWMEEVHIRNCIICRRQFTNSLRKHHCRLCGKVFCGDCTKDKIHSATSKDSVRCCIICADFRNRFLVNPHKSKDIVNSSGKADSPLQRFKKRDSRDSFLSITSLGDTQEISISQSIESNCSNHKPTLSQSSFDLKYNSTDYYSTLDDVKVNSITCDAPYECLVGDYSEIIVNPKRVHCEDIIVSSGMTIVWEFVTERPIQFRLTYRSSAIIGVDSKEEDLIPFTSYGSTTKELPHVGHYSVEKAGVYRLVFSNETSILQSRKISYKVKLTNTYK